MKKFGYAKGSLSKGGSAALQRWVKEENSTIPIVDDPLSLRVCKATALKNLFHSTGILTTLRELTEWSPRRFIFSCPTPIKIETYKYNLCIPSSMINRVDCIHRR